MNRNQNDFLALLNYELQNRAFAYSAITELRQSSSEQNSQFWESYYQLEAHNQIVYRNIALKYQLPMETSLATRFRVAAGNLFSAIFPETSLGLIRKATVSYIEQLERLRELSPKSDSDFAEYIVLQEKAQAEALTSLSQGQPEKATEILQGFFLKEQLKAQLNVQQVQIVE